MYISQINSTTNFGCAQMLTKTPKLMNRSLLQKTSNLKNLHGPAEKRKAEKWVAGYTTGNSLTAAALAQAGGLEEFLLSGIEVAMAAHILNGIYKFDLSPNLIKIIGTGLTGHYVGKGIFKWLTKTVTWVPLVGNGINAVVAGSTTAALGAALIKTAENMDEARKRGEKMEDIIKKLQEFIKKMG